jgi:hypothetical protein
MRIGSIRYGFDRSVEEPRTRLHESLVPRAQRKGQRAKPTHATEGHATLPGGSEESANNATFAQVKAIIARALVV